MLMTVQRRPRLCLKCRYVDHVRPVSKEGGQAADNSEGEHVSDSAMTEVQGGSSKDWRPTMT